MPLHDFHSRLPVRLFLRAPRRKARARPRLQHAPQLGQCPRRIGKKHYSEPAGSKIESRVREWQRVRIRLPRGEVRQLLVPRASGSNLQQIRALIQCRHRPLRSHPLRQCDPRLARPACQVERRHARKRLRVFHQPLRHRAPQQRRFRLPLFRRHQPIRRTPR